MERPMRPRAAFLVAVACATACAGAAPGGSAPGCTRNAAPQSATAGNAPCGTFGYFTRFASAENPLSEGAKWIDGKAVGLDWNDPSSSAGRVHASVLSGRAGSRYDDSIAHLARSFRTFKSEQYAQASVYRANGYSAKEHEIELLLRFSVGPHAARGYEILWGLPGYLAVVRWNGPRGNYTPLFDPGAGSIPAPRTGDVLRAEIVGSIITVKRNGKTVASVDVAARGGTVWTSGQPGIGFWPVGSSVPDRLGWESFEAGDL